MNIMKWIGIGILFWIVGLAVYTGTSSVPFLIAMLFVLGMSGMLFYRVFSPHTLYFTIAMSSALVSGSILLAGWIRVAWYFG